MKLPKQIRRGNNGFSLVELTFAMFVLAVGVLGGLVIILMGMTRDNSNRVDTTATNAAQAVIEEIGASPINNIQPLTVTDCLGNNLSINPTGAVAPGSGAPLLANGDIDWKQPPALGYQMNYTVCGNNGLKTTYDVRWHVTLVGPGNTGRLIVVSARQPFVATNNGIGFIAPVTLRTIVGM
jgi:type II secretory pathway pseudopilin PulG